MMADQLPPQQQSNDAPNAAQAEEILRPRFWGNCQSGTRFALGCRHCCRYCRLIHGLSTSTHFFRTCPLDLQGVSWRFKLWKRGRNNERTRCCSVVHGVPPTKVWMGFELIDDWIFPTNSRAFSSTFHAFCPDEVSFCPDWGLFLPWVPPPIPIL